MTITDTRTRPASIRTGPSPYLSQTKYFREMDRVCAAPRSIARSTGLGGPYRKDYALLSLCPPAPQDGAL